MDTRTARVLVLIADANGDSKRSVQSALFAIKWHSPERIILVCTREFATHVLPSLITCLRWQSYRLPHLVCVCESADDAQALLLEWTRNWRTWFDGIDDDDVVVDLTAASSSMAAVGFTLAYAQGAKRISYVVEQRAFPAQDAPARMVYTLSPDALLVRRRLEAAAAHFAAGDYAVARQTVAAVHSTGGIADHYLAEVAESLVAVAGAYADWRRFDWKAAAHILRQSRHKWRQWSWFEHIERLHQNYALIIRANELRKQQRPDHALIADLLANVEWCLQCHRWDDAVSRLYRACEMLAQFCLQSRYEIVTGKVQVSRLPPSVRERYEVRQRGARDGVLRLGLEEAFTLLAELGDPLGTAFHCGMTRQTGKSSLSNLLTCRNNSLLAHGVQPISEAQARALQAAVTALTDIADAEVRAVWLPKAKPVVIGRF